MKNISLTGIDDDTDRKLKQEARRKKVSVNALILELIRRGIGATTSRQVSHDLDTLAGTWSDGEAAEFLKSLADFERIDKELWGETDSSGH